MTVQAELSIQWHCKIYDMKENVQYYVMVGSFLKRVPSLVVLIWTEKCD
jgi:hypothetical protein